MAVTTNKKKFQTPSPQDLSLFTEPVDRIKIPAGTTIAYSNDAIDRKVDYGKSGNAVNADGIPRITVSPVVSCREESEIANALCSWMLLYPRLRALSPGLSRLRPGRSPPLWSLGHHADGHDKYRVVRHHTIQIEHEADSDRYPASRYAFKHDR